MIESHGSHLGLTKPSFYSQHSKLKMKAISHSFVEYPAPSEHHSKISMTSQFHETVALEQYVLSSVLKKVAYQHKKLPKISSYLEVYTESATETRLVISK